MPQKKSGGGQESVRIRYQTTSSPPETFTWSPPTEDSTWLTFRYQKCPSSALYPPKPQIPRPKPNASVTETGRSAFWVASAS